MMFTLQSLVLGTALLAFAYLLRWTYTLLEDPLRDIPGPVLARYTRYWLVREYARGHYETTNRALHKHYGPIVRIAPNQYSIDDGSAIKVLYGHGSQFLKSNWYTVWGHPSFANLFNITDPKEHGSLRRKIANPYAMSSLVSYEPVIDQCSSILLKRFVDFANKNETVDLAKWFQYYAFDVIGQITFSVRFGCMEKGEDVDDCIQAIDDGNKYSSVCGVFPGIHTPFMRFGDVFSLAPKGINSLMNRVRHQISTVKQDFEKSSDATVLDFVQKLVKVQNDTPTKISEKDILSSAAGNVFAGSDTTSISLSAIIYHLYRSRPSLAKLREELDKAEREGMISDPMTWEESQRLPYLQAVIKEGLRVHPATGFTMPRIVPEGGKTVAGRFFPAGEVVGVNPWVAHCNTGLFGEDAREFRPERWLGIDKSTRSEQESNFMTFGQGARTCVGKNISLLELSKIVPQLVRQFDFEGGDDVEWRCENHWFVKPVDFCRRIKMRGPR